MKKTLILYIVLSIFIATASAQVNTNLYKQADKHKTNQWVDSVYNTMSIDDKVGQLFIPIVEPNSSWRNRIAGYIQNYKVGGLLFSKGTLAIKPILLTMHRSYLKCHY